MDTMYLTLQPWAHVLLAKIAGMNHPVGDEYSLGPIAFVARRPVEAAGKGPLVIS
jgi:hypothetical protein